MNSSLFPESTRNEEQNYSYVREVVKSLEMDIVDVKELNDPVVKIIMRNLGKDYENVSGKLFPFN
jgi:hypothetical protein